MNNIGQYKIWLTGSRRTIRRCVYEDQGKSFIIWGGKYIEVKRGNSEYYSVELY